MSAGSPAPRGLRPEEVGELVREARPCLRGARLEKVFHRGDDAFYFRFRMRRDRWTLLCSLRAGFTRFHLVDEPEDLPPRPSLAASELRELLGGGVVEELDRPGGDRLLRLEFSVPREGGRSAKTVVFELFGRRGRLLVLEGRSRRVVFAAGRRGVRVGESYRYPPPPLPRPDAPVLLPFDPLALVPEEARGEPLVFHRALARQMEQAERRADEIDLREELARRVDRARRRREALLEKIAADRERAEGWPEWRRQGELLNSERARLRRGMTEVEVVDYFDPALPRVRIALDPTLSPAENIDAFFRRARKGERALEPLAARTSRLEEEAARLRELREGVAEGDLEALTDIRRELDRQLDPVRISHRRRGPAEGSSRRAGPRRFVSREGLEILCGRSARENEEVTRGARGNDLFFHLAHRPGPHVILRVPRGRNAAPESIDDAAFLAAYLGGWRGPGPAVVHWTRCKYVRKPRGAPPGKVHISQEREFRVEFEPDRLARLVPARRDE